MSDDTKYKLSPEAHESFYQLIKARAYGKSTPVDRPTVVFLGGQPGAGKSFLARIVETKESDNIIKIDPDDIRELHPHVKKMMEEGEINFFRYSKPDVDQAYDRLIREAREDKHNVKIEGKSLINSCVSRPKGLGAVKK